MKINSPYILGSLTVTGNSVLSGSITAFDDITVSGSLNVVQGITGSLQGSASYAVSASHVIGGVNPFPYTGSAQLTGSLDVTGSVELSYNFNSPAAWSAGGAMILGRSTLGGTGTQNAALAFGGFLYSCTEEYNGSSWSVGGALIFARDFLAGAGTQNAGLAFGGSAGVSRPCTEEYNGTSWSAGGDLSTARYSLGGAGTQNAALAFAGGGGYGIGNFVCTEEYNGSSWSSGVSLSTARYQLGGAGTQNAGLAFGGYSGYPLGIYYSCTEEYNGAVSSLIKTFDYSDTTGYTTVSCLIETSAERYKSNIQPMESQLPKVMQLQPVEFDWKSNNKHDIGFVADSVKNVYPNLVSTNAQGEVEGMNYSKLVSALVKSIQEQQMQINQLQSKIDNLNIN